MSPQADGKMGSVWLHTQINLRPGQMFLPWRVTPLPPFPALIPSGNLSALSRFKWSWPLLRHKGCKSAGKGFWHMIQHLWCHQQLTCLKTFEKWGSYCKQNLSWNSLCFCIKLLRLQTEWLLLESDSIIYLIP